MNRTAIVGLSCVALAITIFPFTAAALAVEYSPPVADDYPRQVFWGDTHLHTNQSPDAFTFGN